MSILAVTVIVTVFNEEKTISDLLRSLLDQTYPIQQLIITDACSFDKTEEHIRKFQKKYPDFPLQLIKVKGNRSIGRNVAIAAATTSLIAITDAGCLPKPTWLAELMRTYVHAADSRTSNQGLVVAGYYDAKVQTPFEEAVVPYVLVMPDQVKPHKFLPATRSMLIEKNVWEKVGGFNEQFRWNEDFEFANRLRAHQIPICFSGSAIVSWISRHNLKEFWTMINHFALGDVQAGIWRLKVRFVFVRYSILTCLLLGLSILHAFTVAILIVLFGLGIYSLWAILKNYRYVPHGWYWLPVLQLTADEAVISGSLAGWLSRTHELATNSEV